MESFIRHFRRVPDGWVCIAQADLDLPTGRIQVAPGTKFTRGTKFMNVDVAKMLDDEYERQQRRS